MNARRGFLAGAGRAALALGLVAFTSSADGSEELRAVLRQHSAADERGSAELVAALAALGPSSVPILYGLVTGQGLDELVGEEWRHADWRCTPEEIPGLCAQALARAPGPVVREHIARVLEGAPVFQERIVALRILAAQGSADGLELLLRAAEGIGDLELLSPSARRKLREAFGAILSRDERSWTFISKKLDTLEPTLCEVLVEAIGAAARPRGMSVLARLFARGVPAPTRVAEAMAQLERARPWDLAGQTLQHCAAWFRSQEPAERALVARLAGGLHALETVPALIELADEGDPLVRRCAAEALQAMAGLPLASDNATLEAWYEREQAWKSARWTQLCAELVAARPGPANEALHELRRHPLYRHDVARVLAESLLQQPHAVALSACRELEDLGSLWAVPGLVAALEGESSQLRAAAWRTLRALTGEEWELSAELWQTLIDSNP